MSKEKIFKYEFENYLKRKSGELFGRETSLLGRRKLEENFKKEIFGPLPSISKRDIDSVVIDLERNKWKEMDKTKRRVIENKISFLKRFTNL